MSRAGKLIRNAIAVVSVGSESMDNRSLFRSKAMKAASTAVIFTFAALSMPGAIASQPYWGQQNASNMATVESNRVDQIPARIVSVRTISDNSYYNGSSYRERDIERRTDYLLENTIGSVIGGLIGDRIGDGNGRQVARAAGAIGGAMIANKIAKSREERRYSGGNIQVDNTMQEITVAVDVPGVNQRYRITQPAGNYTFRSGDLVYIVPTSNPNQVAVIPRTGVQFDRIFRR